MPGTLNIALTQQFDIDGNPLSGGLLYFFQAASTTPQNAFQDIALTILHPNPIILPADGRVPMFYLASTASEGNPCGQIKIRLTDYTGVTVFAADSLLIIGPASGGGGGGGSGVDATSVFSTGDIKPHFGTGDLEGWVPCNGETIGSELSSARYFGAEMEFLFKYLWNTGVLPVFAGTVPARGANANEDWDANRRIVLPDLRGRTIAGLDDMGSTPANRLGGLGLGGGVTGTTLGNAGGQQTITISAGNLPNHTHPLASNVQFSGSLIIGTEVDINGNGQDHTHPWGTSGGSSGGAQGVNGRFGTYAASQAGYNLDHAHTGGVTVINIPQGTLNPATYGAAGSNTGSVNLDHAHYVDVGGTTGGRSAGHYHAISGSTQPNAGAGTNATLATTQPTMVMTFYIKL